MAAAGECVPEVGGESRPLAHYARRAGRRKQERSIALGAEGSNTNPQDFSSTLGAKREKKGATLKNSDAYVPIVILLLVITSNY